VLEVSAARWRAALAATAAALDAEAGRRLRACPVLQPLTDEEVQRLIPAAERLEVRPGQVLVRQGEPQP